MTPKIVDIIGLFVALLGALLLAWGLIVRPKRAIQVSVSRVSEETDEQNKKLPHTRDRLRESYFAFWGGILLAVGFVLQILGRW